MKTVQELLDEGVLIAPELLKDGIEPEILEEAVKRFGNDLLVIDKDLVDQLRQEINNTSQEQSQEESSLPKNKASVTEGNVDVLWSYEEPSKKRSYDDFVKILNIRFKETERMLKSRQELASTTSISRIRVKQERESVAFIGMIIDKSETANGNMLFTVEDLSGQIKLLVSQRNQDLFDMAKDIQLDETLGFTGMGAGEIVFADAVYYPDVPLTKEFKKAPVDEYAIMVGDPHFGSKVFMAKEFQRFLLWLRGEMGNDVQKEIAKKVKYVFITGDLIEGVGIYPSQEDDLAIQDITKQYEFCASYLRQIPEHMNIILFTGNHDAGRLSEPQEPLMKTYAKSLYDLPNVTIVSNPAMVNIAATSHFPGFDCLVYHGGSFIYYSDNIPSIRAAGGQKRVDLIMKYLLQRRHLAPTHNAALTIPTTDRDWMLIDRVPDFFISGHIHRTSVSNYRNVTCINSGCWTETTEDQVKRGLEPMPAKLVLVNLKTRAAKVMNFLKEEKVVSRGSDQKKKESQEEAHT